MIKRDLPGLGVPSPGLASYALSLVRSEAGESPGRDHHWDASRGLANPRRLLPALGQYGLGLGSPAEAEAALDGLINALDDEDPLVREVAVECLYEMGPKAIRAADAADRQAGTRPEHPVRWQAARTLTEIARASRP